MPIQPKKFREIPKVHGEIGDVEKQLTERRELAEHKKEEADRHDKELIREIIKEKIEKQTPAKVKPTVAEPPVKKTIVKKAKTLKGEKKERQIRLLTDLAFEKGVVHATEVAQKLEDPYILDEFHDALIDELYNYLVEQGKLKQV